jgi:hypothetical protein
MLARQLAAALALACCAQMANGLYFYVTEGQHRCFLEDVPSDTLVVGHYKNPDLVEGANNQPAQVRCPWGAQ